MRLKHLDIFGFKSFCEKTAVSFPAGISAVVGPNGCGKSNIIDALRWVMGEQSARQLRGKSMEDVIFAGAKGRPPLNLAEVTLTLANDNGTAPAEFKDYSEISITRRQYRSGERAYLLNRQPCRLKDILNIFMGSGMGARSCAIIQQGNIGAITDAGPDERRIYIEEAAGITRFKARKQEALAKVQSTGQNLARLQDIIAEIQRQMGSLQRQAKKAEQYKAHRERIRILDLHLALRQHDSLTERIAELDALIETQRDTDRSHHTALQQIDAAVAAIRLEQTRKNQAIDDRRQRRYSLQRAADRIETDAAHLREEIGRLEGEISALGESRSDITDRNRAMVEEIARMEASLTADTEKIRALDQSIESQRQASEDLRRRQAETAQALAAANAELMALAAKEARYRNIQQTAAGNRENLKRRLRRLEEEICLAEEKVAASGDAHEAQQGELEGLRAALAAANEDIAAKGRELEAHNRRLAEQVRQVQTLEFERGKLRARHGTLKKMEDNLEWYRDGVRAVMCARKEAEARGEAPPEFTAGIVGILADMICPEPGFAVATEAILGEALQYIVVQTPAAARAAIEYLRRNEKGRTGFIPLSTLKPAAAQAPAAPGERLLDHVRIRAGFEPLAEAIMGHVRIVADLGASENGNSGLAAVTEAGDTATGDGWICGGSAAPLSGILAKKQELAAIETELADLDARMEEGRKLQAELENAGRGIEKELQRRAVEKQELADEVLQLEKAVYRIGEELRHARSHLEVLALEKEQLEGEESDAAAEMSRYDRAVAETAAQVRAGQAAVARLTTDGGTLAAELEAFDQRIVELKLERTAVGTGLDNARQTLRRLVGFHQDARQRLARIEQDLTAKNERRHTAAAEIDRCATALKQQLEELHAMDAAIAAHDAELAAIEERLKESDRRAAELQQHRNRALETIRELEMERSRQQVRCEAVLQRLAENYGQEPGAARSECARHEDHGRIQAADDAGLESELEDLRRRVAAITDVNLGAIAEYEQLKTRHDFLETQRSDLVKALEDLNQVIRKINKISQTRFIETLEQVNEKMQEVFPRLFEGGAARLVMSDPDTPLESGVEFLIHPPGKKLTRMSLLSGGEKAMAAIAFIFSIFLIKPASFCLLDEIDAPLDEANVTRFNNLLRLIGEQSQIVMITHNKRSMEFADTLLGVTMPQKGISKIVSVNLEKIPQAA